MSKLIDLTGKRFNRWLVIKRVKSTRREARYLCICECGNKKKIYGYTLRAGTSKSCGCYSVEKSTERIIEITKNQKGNLHPSYKHGLSKHRFFAIFININSRCNNKKIDKYRYSRYGGRGIKCEWNNFYEFKNDMYESYLEHVKKYGIKNTTIDRRDNNGNYCKNNCCWSTRKEQARNRGNSCILKYKGKEMTLAEWAEKFNINYKSLQNRISTLKWSTKKALETPINL